MHNIRPGQVRSRVILSMDEKGMGMQRVHLRPKTIKCMRYFDITLTSSCGVRRRQSQF